MMFLTDSRSVSDLSLIRHCHFQHDAVVIEQFSPALA